MLNSMATINVNVNNKVKKEATEILDALGISMSTAINIFLTQVTRTRSIPFEIISPKPTRRLKKALKEADKIVSGKINSKGYDDVDELFKDLDNID